MEKNCAFCGNPFVAKRVTALYCSTNCRVKAAKFAENPAEEQSRSLAITASETDDELYDEEANLAAFRKIGLEKVGWITTGIPEFDALTMIPRGRITQIQGPTSVGKTTLCLNMVRGLRDKKILYIDTEAALNPQLLVSMRIEAKNFEVNNKSAFIEDIYETVIQALEKPKYDMIILDSLAACTFRTEAANAAADANLGQKAKIVAKLMRIIPMELKRTDTALVIINQERDVIGGYVPQIYTPGGKSVEYAASLIIRLKTTKGARFPKSGPPYRGHEILAEIIKSKVNDPWRRATFKLFYGDNNGQTHESPAPDVTTNFNITSKTSEKNT